MEEEKGISLADMFRMIFSQKWLALIIAAVITVVGVLGFTYVYNPRASVYTVKYNLNLPGGNNGVYYKYPDGTILYFNSVISENSIKNICKDNESFEDINIEKMISRGDITFKVEAPSKESTDNEEVKQFVISVKKRYFPNDNVAREFLTELASVPVKFLRDMKIDTYMYLNLASNAMDYETEIENIVSQVDYLRNEYRTLINIYGYSFTVETGKTLQYYLLELENFLDTQIIENLLTEIRDNFYIKSLSLKAKYELDLKACEREFNKASATLENLLKVTTTDSTNAQVIKNQSDLVETLRYKKQDLTNYIERGVVNPDIENEIQAIADTVREFTRVYESTVVNAIYDKLSFVSFSNINVLTVDGGTGLVTSVVLSLVIGIVIALITAFIVGWVKKKKKETAPVPDRSRVSLLEMPVVEIDPGRQDNCDLPEPPENGAEQ